MENEDKEVKSWLEVNLTVDSELAEAVAEVLSRYAENGVLKYVVGQYIKPLNDCFEKHECLKCGAIHEKEGSDQVQGFF